MSFFQLVKPPPPMISSSSFGPSLGHSRSVVHASMEQLKMPDHKILWTMDTFRGPSLGTLKHNLTVPRALIGVPFHQLQDEPGSFHLINPDVVRGADGSWSNDNTSCEILGPGMILLKNYVSFLGQVDIVNECHKLGLGPGGFYEPTNRFGQKIRLHMMCLGRNWDPVTGYKNSCRSDGSEPPPIPYGLQFLIKTALKEAQVHLDELPSMCPDTCLVNFYSCVGRLGLHQDCDESSDSLKRGLPVVSISIGDTAEFWYGHTRDVNKLAKVFLESGDVLIFGGKSRLIYHGVKDIFHNTFPHQLALATCLRSGRLNLVLRQF